MKQECVYLHTFKNLQEAETILQENGFAVISKLNDIFLDVNEMNDEEKRSYLETIRNEFSETLEEIGSAEVTGEVYFKKLQMLKRTIFEIVDLLDKTSNQQVIEKFNLLLAETKKINDIIEVFDKLTRTRYSIIHVDHRPKCSMLIAKKGEEIIRYLEFDEDPVITINGPNAINLKSTLEKLF